MVVPLKRDLKVTLLDTLEILVLKVRDDISSYNNLQCMCNIIIFLLQPWHLTGLWDYLLQLFFCVVCKTSTHKFQLPAAMK